LNHVIAQLEVTTKAVEDVKRDVTAGLWLDQQRWQLRREVHVPLLVHLDRLKAGIWLAWDKGGTHDERLAAFRAVLDARSEDVDVLRAKALARLVLPDTLLKAIGEIESELLHLASGTGVQMFHDLSAKRLGQYADLIESGYRDLIKDARRDLSLLAPEAEDPEAIERRNALTKALNAKPE